MPRLLFARATRDEHEQKQIERLAKSRHAPHDVRQRALMVQKSWEGKRTSLIAKELACHPQTVRERLLRFNDEGIDGLLDRTRAGRKRRLSEHERGQLITLVARTPPGRLERQRDGTLEALDEKQASRWTLDSLVEAAQQRGIQVGRSQMRRILLAEGVRWRSTRQWATSEDPEFAQKSSGDRPLHPATCQQHRPVCR